VRGVGRGKGLQPGDTGGCPLLDRQQKPMGGTGPLCPEAQPYDIGSACPRGLASNFQSQVWKR
jgi:hypothetical protein